MFITTKSEFIWDGNKYVETHTEGYEYEGELSLADIEDELSSGNVTSTPYQLNTTTNTVGSDFPNLQDLLGMPIDSVLSRMGFTDAEVSDYDYMVPEYDPYFSNIALDEYNLDLESIGLKEEGYKAQIDTATSLYDITKKSQSSDLYSVSQAGETQGYQAYGQESAALAGGLGSSRARRIGDMGRETIETGVGSESERIRRSGEQSKVQYESAIDASERDILALDQSRASSLMSYEKAVGTSERDFQDEFWNFIGFLDEKDIKFDD